MDLVYLSNDMVVDRGRSCLRFFKLRDQSSSINCVTECCYTTVLVEHPSYQGAAVLAFPDICHLTTKPIPPAARLFAEDFPASKRLALEPTMPALAEPWQEARDRPLPVQILGQRFQELLAERGGEVTVLDLPEGASLP